MTSIDPEGEKKAYEESVLAFFRKPDFLKIAHG
jgi:hypothetical protein